jgi:hypothetical protein
MLVKKESKRKWVKTVVGKLNKETRILLKVLRKPWKASFITAGFPHEI